MDAGGGEGYRCLRYDLGLGIEAERRFAILVAAERESRKEEQGVSLASAGRFANLVRIALEITCAPQTAIRYLNTSQSRS
jgi:hypothetical protein